MRLIKFYFKNLKEKGMLIYVADFIVYILLSGIRRALLLLARVSITHKAL